MAFSGKSDWIFKIVLVVMCVAQIAMAQGEHWPPAAKNGFGTSTTLGSKVWFTLANGVMTEVFYPTVDRPKVATLQFQIVTGTKIENEVDDTGHRLQLPNPSSLTFTQINRAKSGTYTITKTYVTDPRRSSVLIRVDFNAALNARLYINYVPVSDKSVLISNCGLPTLQRR